MYDYLSKIMSHALRHSPDSYGLTLDAEGWVPITEICDRIREKEPSLVYLEEAHIYECVISSEKKRHEIVNKKIRAIYGHSIETTPIYTLAKPPNILYHGTSRRAFRKIICTELKPMGRMYVHLSTNKDIASRVALRHDPSPVILKIQAAEAFNTGVNFYSVNDNNIWLSEAIPVTFIKVE